MPITYHRITFSFIALKTLNKKDNFSGLRQVVNRSQIPALLLSI